MQEIKNGIDRTHLVIFAFGIVNTFKPKPLPEFRRDEPDAAGRFRWSAPQ